jgi:hypothetical protein
MTSRIYRGSIPPKAAVQVRFCTFLDYTEVPGAVEIGRAYGFLYLLSDGRVVVDPFSRDGSEVATIFSEMPDGFEIMGDE